MMTHEHLAYRVRLPDGDLARPPLPRKLAEVFAVPLFTQWFELFRHDGELVYREIGSDGEPRPVSRDRVAELLQEYAAALPDRTSWSRGWVTYRDVQNLARDGDPKAARVYFLAVVDAMRDIARKYRPPRPPRPHVVSTERVRKHRQCLRACDAENVEWFLDEWLETATPGERVPAADLYAEAKLSHDVPGPRVFYRLADTRLGNRRRGTGGTLYYTVPTKQT